MPYRYLNTEKIVFSGHNADVNENAIVARNNLQLEANNTNISGSLEVNENIKIKDDKGLADVNDNKLLYLSANGTNLVFNKPIDFNNVAVSNFTGGGGAGGGLPISGDGNIEIGTGNISITNGTITSTSGDISTGGTADIVSGRNFILDGDNIQKRTENAGVVTLTEYTIHKGCAFKNTNNNFTIDQTFQENILMSGTNKTLNNSQGSIISGTSNIETMTCGSVDCDNGAVNEVRAKVLHMRTSGNTLNGWKIEQQPESNPAQPLDKILQIKPAELGAYATITAGDFAGIEPSIILDPQSQALGGKIVCNKLNLGTDASQDFILEQPRSGADTDNLLIKIGNGTNSKIKFQNSSGTDLMFIEEATPGAGDGRIYLSDGLYFGVSGIHNSITESGNNLLIDQNNANSETQIRDNSNNPIISVKKTEVVLSNSIPLNYGLYSTLPIQYKLNRTITIAANADTTNFTNMAFNCRSDTFTRVNDNTSVSMYNALLEGFYKCVIQQTGLSSAGNFNNNSIMFDYIYHLSIQSQPDINYSEPSFNYQKKPTNQSPPTIRIDHLNTPIQSQPVFLLYPNQSAGETMPIEVRLTKLNY